METPELRVLIATPLQLVPIAGREQNAIAVENVSAPDLARQRIQPRIALRPLHAVVFEDLRLARQKILIVRHLIVGRESEQRGRGRSQHPLQPNDRLAERLVNDNVPVP